MNEKPTHFDLFSGIGGFAIAARAAGFETVAFCEADERCRTFLEKTWCKTVHPDIRTFDAKPYRGISLLTGGPPCQPASRAGKQGGAGDDRWLWPQALRVLGEAEPDCVNPPGIADVGLDGILSEMGGLGYEVQVFDIPACAVDSPQLRHRFWIVGFLADADKRRKRDEFRRSTGGKLALSHIAASNGNNVGLPDSDGFETRKREATTSRHGHPVESATSRSMADPQCERSGQDEQERGAQGRAVDRRDYENELADTASPGRERPDAERGENGCRPPRPQSLVADSTTCRRRQGCEDTGGPCVRTGETREWLRSTNGDGAQSWQNSVWVPCADGKLRRAPDDSFGLVDGLHRSLLAALGNSICPRVAYEILRAIKTTLTKDNGLAEQTTEPLFPIA